MNMNIHYLGIVIVSAVIMAGAEHAFAQTVYLSVKKTASKTESEDRWKNRKGSYVEEKTSSITLEIGIRNMLHTAQDCQVKWFFIAENLTREDLLIYDAGAESFSLGGGTAQTLTKTSRPITSAKADFVNAGKYEKGLKFEGYLVLVVQDGKTVTSKGSSRAISDLADNPAQLEALVEDSKRAFSKNKENRENNKPMGRRRPWKRTGF